MIPNLIDIGGIWNVLPPGIHDATLTEVEQCYATNVIRKTLYDGFRKGVIALSNAGCKAIFLNGSFVSDKPDPGDFDSCWDPTGYR